jgi:hypothetical protein
MRLKILAIPLLAGIAGPAVARDFDIPWFAAHPDERVATLRLCEKDHRTGQSLICDNAQSAERDAYIARLQADAGRLEKLDPGPSRWMQTGPRQLTPTCMSYALPGHRATVPPCRKL